MTKLTMVGCKKYITKKPWEEGTRMNVDDGTALGGKFSFFEAFLDKAIFRGEADTPEKAEDIAWEKYQSFQKCNHSFKRVNETGLAICEHCNVRGVFLKDISVCHCCERPPLGYVGYNQYCINHYLEAVEEELQKKTKVFSHSFLEFSKVFFEVVTKLDLITESSTKEDIEKVFHSLNRKVSNTILNLAEELIEDFAKSNEYTEKETSIYWGQHFDTFSNELMKNHEIVTMIVNGVENHVVLSKCRSCFF